MPLTDSLRDDILASVPSLRAFAISLSGNGDRADDLVQETLLRALANIDSFQPGSNLAAWLFTILRNLFRSDYRKRRREVEDADGSYAKTLKTQPAQNAHLEFEEFRAALEKLPQDQREALILVGASGFSYEDAAAICGCAVGTIKSRVNRARPKLAALLYVDGAEDFGPDETVRAVSGVNGSRQCLFEHDLFGKPVPSFPDHALPHRPHRRRELLGAIAFVHVDDGLHRRDQLVDVAHLGEIALRGAAERFRGDAVEQDDAEIAVRPARRLGRIELFPAKMKNRVGLLARHFPFHRNVRMLADQRQALVGMRSQLEEQQREALGRTRADGDIGPAHRNTVGVWYRAGFEQAFQLHALPLAFAEQRHHVGHGMDAADQQFARDVDVGPVAQGSRHDRLDHRKDVLDPVVELVDHGRQPALKADPYLDLAGKPQIVVGDIAEQPADDTGQRQT